MACVGHQNIVTPAASTALTVPAAARWCVVQASAQALRVALDGTAATATNGTQVPAGKGLKLKGGVKLSDVRLIQETAGATAIVTYFDDLADVDLAG